MARADAKNNKPGTMKEPLLTVNQKAISPPPGTGNYI